MSNFILLFLLGIIFSFQSKLINYEKEGTIALLTINNFDLNKVNDLNKQILDELIKTLNNIDQNSINVIIIKNFEKTFLQEKEINKMNELTKYKKKIIIKMKILYLKK